MYPTKVRDAPPSYNTMKKVATLPNNAFQTHSIYINLSLHAQRSHRHQSDYSDKSRLHRKPLKESNRIQHESVMKDENYMHSCEEAL
jgi:hypothetical protein